MFLNFCVYLLINSKFFSFSHCDFITTLVVFVTRMSHNMNKPDIMRFGSFYQPLPQFLVQYLLAIRLSPVLSLPR